MTRLWCLPLALVPLAGVAAFVAALVGWGPLAGAWLPPNHSRQGATIDHLFVLIHVIIGVMFVVTTSALAWMVWRFEASGRTRAQFLHGRLSVEVLWTAVPGLILVFLAFYQFLSWADNKISLADEPGIAKRPPLARVVARQFGWSVQYPGPDQAWGTDDDQTIDGEVVVPDDETVVLTLESHDVIHSFFVPQLRLKQDIVPGLVHRVWFTPLRQAEMEFVCAELCGWGHYKMRGRLRIVSRAEFTAFLAQQQ
jgi:cytochrome c oxidase subunit 2